MIEKLKCALRLAESIMLERNYELLETQSRVCISPAIGIDKFF